MTPSLPGIVARAAPPPTSTAATPIARTKERPHSLRRQRRYVQPLASGRGRQVAEHGPQRMPGAELVVAVGREDDAAGTGDPSPDEAQRVERGLVRPVHVLGDHHRVQPQLVQKRGEELVLPEPGLEQRRHRRHVVEGRERPRGGERVARAPEDADPLREALDEAARQARLARARLAAEEDEPTRSGPRLLQARFELVEIGLALDELHGVRRPRGRSSAPASARRPA
jgi:hypothetical protein